MMDLYPLFVLGVGVSLVVALIMWLRINAFFALITAAIAVSLMSPGADKISRVAQAFGATAGGIGIVIATAAVIGKCLMESGAADRIVRSLLAAVGERRAPLALMGSGFVLSVPVFFDTVFYLLIPIARSMWHTKRRNYVFYVTAIVAGGAVTHSMVPPTPGPLAMADNLGIDLGVMMIAGVLIGIPMSLVGLGVCWILNRWQDDKVNPFVGEAEVELPTDELPPLWISVVPVVLPVLLIATNTVASAVLGSTDGDSMPRVLSIVKSLGNPNMALLLSAAVSIYLVVRYRKSSLTKMSGMIEQALMSGGMVILITAAGGAFGKMLAFAGIKETIQSVLTESNSAAGINVLLAAFVVAMLMKFAQGSGTVSMITTSSIFAAMAFTPEQLGFNLVYLATAIGSGSLVGDWMNNSGFWIYSKMSDLTTTESLKTWSILTAALGVTGLIVTIVAAQLLPMR